MPGISNLGRGIGLGGGAFNWNGYWSKNLLQYFDGTVDGGSLVDKSINGLDATLTGNALRNADCEGDWGFTKYGSASPTIARSTTQVHGGTYSWKCTCAGGGANLGMNGPAFYVKTGQTYNYSGWVYKETAETSGRIYVRIYDGDGITLIVSATQIARTVYGSWINFTGSFTATKTGSGAFMNWYTSVDTQAWYVDDLSVSNQDTADLYIRLQSNASIIAADIDNKFFDTSGNPYTVNCANTEPYYNANMLYDLPNKKLMLSTTDILGKYFENAHDWLNWNPITSLITNVKTVKKDGTGDYLTIQAALAGITDATAAKKYRIDVYDDWTVTDKADYTLNGSFYHWIILKDYIYFNGVGASKIKITCSIPADSNDTETAQYEPFDLNKISGFNNFEISNKNGRYGVHLDSSIIAYMYNCDVIHYGNSEVVAYRIANSLPAGDPYDGASLGHGISTGRYNWFYNCQFIGRHPVQTHDNIDTTKSSVISFTKCNLTSSYTTALFCNCLGNTTVKGKVIINKCTLTGKIDYDGYVYKTGAASGVSYLLDSLRITGGNNSYSTYTNNYTEGGSLKITSATSGAVHVTGGTAQAVIMPTPDEASNYSIGQLEVGEWLLNANLKLGVRLGDCSGVNKTLTGTIDGNAFTITFNENFTAKDNAYVLAFINTALSGAGIASLYQRASEYIPTGL
jgi:hypothetical protein